MAVGSDDETVRAARNQALYRQVNEKVKELNETFDAILSIGSTWVCECKDASCTKPVEMTLAEYETLRSHPNHFAVLPGHEDPDVERTVEEEATYLVVAKLGQGAHYAIEHDPRGERI